MNRRAKRVWTRRARRGRARTRRVLATGILTAGALGIATTAMALWSAYDTTQVPPVPVGKVAFAAHGQSGTTTPQYSPDGSPVTLTLPRAEILKVLDQTGTDPEPVIWRFTVEGYAQGIVGMNVDVALGSQTGPGGVMADLGSGMGHEGTILALSTLKVYPAAVNDDCSAVPATPQGDAKNIYLYDNTDHVVQSPGAYEGETAVQVWCVAMDFNQTPDATYANEVQAIGTGENAAVHAAVDVWRSVVAFPPSLEAMGLYRNRVDAVGTAEDETISRSHDIYEAMLFPDPDNEPDVTIVLTPAVTNLNPEFSPA